MFQLRDDHMQAFEAISREAFVERALRHLRKRLAQETLAFDDDQVRQRIRDCVGRSARYGLTTEPQVTAFARATFQAGEDFDTDPHCRWAAGLLQSDGVAADVKAAWLLHLAEMESGHRLESAITPTGA